MVKIIIPAYPRGYIKSLVHVCEELIIRTLLILYRAQNWQKYEVVPWTSGLFKPLVYNFSNFSWGVGGWGWEQNFQNSQPPSGCGGGQHPTLRITLIMHYICRGEGGGCTLDKQGAWSPPPFGHTNFLPPPPSPGQILEHTLHRQHYTY